MIKKKASPLFCTQKYIIHYFVQRHILAVSDYRTKFTQIPKTTTPLHREFVP